MAKYYSRFAFVLLILVFASVSNAQGINYYSHYTAGPAVDAADPNNWWTNTDGTGSHPVDFQEGSDLFTVQSGDLLAVSTQDWNITCDQLTISSGGSITVTGSFNVNFAGMMDNQGSYTHSSTAALDNDLIAGFSTMSSSSTFTITTGQTLNGPGSKTFGNLVIGTGSPITVNSSRTFLMSGNLTVDAAATLNMTASGAGVAALSSIGGFVTQSGTGTINISSIATTPIPAAVTWAGTVVFVSNSAQNIVTGNYTNLTSSGSGARTLANSGIIAIAGTFTPGSNSYTVTGSTIEYNGAGLQSNVAGFTYNNLTITNNTNTLTASNNLTVGGTLTINPGRVLNMSTFALAGSLTSNGAGTIRTQHTSTSTPLPTGRTWAQIIEYNSTLASQTVVDGTYNNLLLISNTVGTVAGGNLTPNSLTINSSCTLNMSTFSLSGLGGTITLNGTLSTQNTSGSPIPVSKSWGGTVVYNSSSSQTIIKGNYTNLTTSGGNRTFDATGNINISGTFTPGSGTYTTTSSTVIFDAGVSQNVPGITPSYNDLTISGSATKSLSSDVTVAGTLTLSASSDFLAINGHTLTLQGNTSLTGALKGSSTSNLTVSGSVSGAPTVRFNAAANDSLINTFTLNKTAGSAGVTLGSNVAVTRFLNITAGAFNVNGNIVTLKSTSIANTAQITTVGGTISYGTGGTFTVERFIPNGNRAFRDIAPGVNTATGVNFFETWQESGAAPTNFGTHVTGIAGASPGGVDATTGLDITQTGNVSMYQNINGIFTAITNTKSTKPNVYQSYRVTVRGDRNVNLYQTPQPTSMNGPTVLRTNGQVITGTLTYTTSGVSGNLNSLVGLNANNADGNFSMLGNPYVCSIDWNGLSRTNLAGTYWVFDPTIGTTGAYVTWDGATNSNGSSNVDRYIQPGQGFFVQTSNIVTPNNANPQLIIQESNKAPMSTLTNVFRTQNTINKLSFGLGKFVAGRGNVNMDGAVAVFDAADNNNVDVNDAAKIVNTTDNIAIFRSSKRISIEHRNLPTTNDTIPLRIWLPTNGANYTLTVDSRSFTTGLSAYVIDKYLSTEKLIKVNDTTNIPFTVNTADTATHINRFLIVFRNSLVPLSTVNLKASTKNNGVHVEWNTTNEVNLTRYEVEKSTDGASFKQIGTKPALNGTANNYGMFDAAPQKGANYYRLKIVNADNSIQYSKTVLINLGDIKSEITIYPNPVKGSTLSLQLNLTKGNYSIDIVNSVGQKVVSQSLVHNGGTTTQVIDWSNRKIALGEYILVVTSQDGNRISRPIIIAE